MSETPPRKKQDTVRVTVNPGLRRYFTLLRKTGLYGTDDGSVAQRLVIRGIEQAISLGVIEAIKVQPGEMDE